MDEINSIIDTQICLNTIECLTDKQLLPDYMKCKSVIQKIKTLEKILVESNVCENKIKIILSKFTLELVPPGTKGLIRGLKFNKIVKDFILKFELDNNVFEIEFEKKPIENISEIPDWYIRNKQNGKLLIGMNQIDLWSGGQQLNRGYKYIMTNTTGYKICCVVCNRVKLQTNTSKIFKLFETGFNNKTLCYLNGLKEIIYLYFELPL